WRVLKAVRRAKVILLNHSTRRAAFGTSSAAGLLHQGQQSLEGRAGGGVRVFDVRVQLDRDPSVVTNLADRAKHRREVDCPLAGDQVRVDARGGDVLQVDVADESREPPQGRGRILADAVHVADIEVQADRRRVDLPHKLLELLGRLDQQ